MDTFQIAINTISGRFHVLTSPQQSIRVLVGDMFDVTRVDIDGPVDAVFDRAALVGE